MEMPLAVSTAPGTKHQHTEVPGFSDPCKLTDPNTGQGNSHHGNKATPIPITS